MQNYRSLAEQMFPQHWSWRLKAAEMLRRDHWSVLVVRRRLEEVVAICSGRAGHIFFLLGAFPKLPQVTVSFVVSVCLPACLPACPSVRMEQLGPHWTNFHDI
jgi:hypothetical protein